MADLGIKGKCKVTDMWTGKKVGEFSKEFSGLLVGHASGLYKLNVK
jgi:alpha-galactosidase